MTVYKCDRCGKMDEYCTRIIITDDYMGGDIHLCQKHLEFFRKWVGLKGEENDRTEV